MTQLDMTTTLERFVPEPTVRDERARGTTSEIDVATSAASARRLVRVVGSPGLLVSIGWICLVGVAAFAPGLITSRSPLETETSAKLQAPSWEHLFGTDQLGRDLFARTVHGSALTLQTALLAVVVGLVVGAVIGLLAGFVRGWLDDVSMRLVDVVLAIPSLLLSLALITVLGFGAFNVGLAVGVANIAACARIMRAEVLRVRQSVYVEAAHTGGAGWLRVLVRHVLPNSTGPVVVLATLQFGVAILTVSSLSFLGYGTQPPTPEWGSLVAAGRDFLRIAWWLTTLPGLTVAATVLAANRIAHALDRRYTP
jgi:peptide/nickel transport system permease protein